MQLFITPQDYIKHNVTRHMTKAIVLNIYGKKGLELKAKHNKEIANRKKYNMARLKQVTNEIRKAKQ